MNVKQIYLLLNLEKEELKKKIDVLAKRANLIFDSKDCQKTFILTIDEYLVDYLQLSFSGYRSSSTLEKWMCY